MKTPQPPCHDCDRRTITCHTICYDYKRFRSDLDAYNAVRQKEDEKEMFARESRVKSIARTKRRKNLD